MLKNLLFFTAVMLLLIPCSMGQNRSAFTNGNTIILTIEGIDTSYQFSSNEMLVRYNQNSQKLECVLHLNNLTAANNASPLSMAHDVFFAAKYPEFIIEIEAPTEKINAGNLVTETIDKRTSVLFQGMNREQMLPVLFTPEKRAILFSTSFDIMLNNYQIQLPAKYAPMLTGRIMVSIRNAKWFDYVPR